MSESGNENKKKSFSSAADSSSKGGRRQASCVGTSGSNGSSGGRGAGQRGGRDNSTTSGRSSNNNHGSGRQHRGGGGARLGGRGRGGGGGRGSNSRGPAARGGRGGGRGGGGRQDNRQESSSNNKFNKNKGCDGNANHGSDDPGINKNHHKSKATSAADVSAAAKTAAAPSPPFDSNNDKKKGGRRGGREFRGGRGTSGRGDGGRQGSRGGGGRYHQVDRGGGGGRRVGGRGGRADEKHHRGGGRGGDHGGRQGRGGRGCGGRGGRSTWRGRGGGGGRSRGGGGRGRASRRGSKDGTAAPGGGGDEDSADAATPGGGAPPDDPAVDGTRGDEDAAAERNRREDSMDDAGRGDSIEEVADGEYFDDDDGAAQYEGGGDPNSTEEPANGEEEPEVYPEATAVEESVVVAEEGEAEATNTAIVAGGEGTPSGDVKESVTTIDSGDRFVASDDRNDAAGEEENYAPVVPEPEGRINEAGAPETEGTPTGEVESKSAMLSLPSLPATVPSSRKNGVPMILSRHSHPPIKGGGSGSPATASTRTITPDKEVDAAIPESSSTEGITQNDRGNKGSKGDKTAGDAAGPAKKEKKEKKKRKQEKRKVTPSTSRCNSPAGSEPDDGDDDDEEEEPVSTTAALKALPAQEVSITATTQVKIRRNNESSNSLAAASGNSDSDGPKTILFSKRQQQTKAGAGKKTKKGKKKGGAAGDTSARAARRFNNDVRACVERGDPDQLRELLRDPHNHKFALDAAVLDVTICAYTAAAMFEDAVYCLRNCCLPGTLSAMQAERILACFPQNLRNSSQYAAADMISALCVATAFDPPTVRTYFLRVARGIALEFLEEALSARDRICSAPCERLVRAGTCVVNARLQRGKKPAELIVLPSSDQLGVFLPEQEQQNRGIQAGDAVSILPYAGPYPMSAESLDRNMIEAVVLSNSTTAGNQYGRDAKQESSRPSSVMVIRLQDKNAVNLLQELTDPADGNVYRIDKLANRMGFHRQLTAAVAVASPLPPESSAVVVRDTRRPCPQLIQAITAMDETIDRVMKQNQSVQQSQMQPPLMTSTATLCAAAIPWAVEDEAPEQNDQDAIRAAAHLALEKYNALEGLNESQRLAVEGATTNRLTLVQGPPGTGKTAVAIRILQHWARLAAAQQTGGGGSNNTVSPILATSDSNIAVDNLVEGCAAAGLRVVRLGRPEAIRPELLRFCIDRPNATGQNSGYGSSGAQGFKERMKQLKNAQVICCTCIGSGGDILDSLGCSLDRVLVDEATQATEPAVLVPLMRGCRQLVLVGDHCQLPPTVLSTRAEEEGHGVPLFSRMVACGVPPFMLDTQYRMHPCIAMFPSDLFYGGLLKNGVSAPERRPLAGFPWPREEFPVAYMPVKGDELDDGVSKYNPAEAEAACDAVAALLSGGQCTASDIAVVTPYAAQARLIRRMTKRLLQQMHPNNSETANHHHHHGSQDSRNGHPSSSSLQPSYIEVSSVDGFQGREKEAVVFSAVRSNDYGAIGFTSDWRRVNVSFTRARRALIVIGNDQCLRRGDPDTWSPWLAWADAHGINMDKPGVPRGRYDPEQLRRVRGGTTAAEMLRDVLERQQHQASEAERQQERAEQLTARHVRADGSAEEGVESGEGGGGVAGGGATANGNGGATTLEEDLARMTNSEGNWDDDSDDEGDDGDAHGGAWTSLATTTSSSSKSPKGDDDAADVGAVDVWDL